MNKPWSILGKIGFWLTWPASWIYLRIGTRTRLLMICDKEFLVLRVWLGNGEWMLPGGGVHRNEEPLVGVLREVEEETGVKLQPQEIRLAYRDTADQHGLKFVYDCFVVELSQKPIINMQRGEISAYSWETIKNPKVVLTSDTARAIAWYEKQERDLSQVEK